MRQHLIHRFTANDGLSLDAWTNFDPRIVIFHVLVASRLEIGRSIYLRKAGTQEWFWELKSGSHEPGTEVITENRNRYLCPPSRFGRADSNMILSHRFTQ